MKLLLLLFLFLQGLTGNESDCKAFYEKTLYPISLKGNLIKKEKTDEYYLLYVKNEEEGGKEVIVRLLLAPISNGFKGRIFPNLCE